MTKNINNKSKTSRHLIWLSVSEAASLGGVNDKTIRRALKDINSGLVFKIVKNRYQIELLSLIKYLHINTKLKNKFIQFGLGQFVKEWKE
ncbi:hypothetical protein EOL94_04685 [bacterium]|jgi:hypothetical protein|nr:hypothetical protein [Patescibacteria group bacterium]MDD4444126.1 hypothetical protein [Patescibacteria group bacterium]NCD01357.1 hypothetical protein [bacterium]